VSLLFARLILLKLVSPRNKSKGKLSISKLFISSEVAALGIAEFFKQLGDFVVSLYCDVDPDNKSQHAPFAS
jgi:hypothetical protein